MATDTRLERLTDLLLLLLETTRPLSQREIIDRVPGYPTGDDAQRQAFERDKKLLRSEGVPLESITIDGDDQVGYRVDPKAYYLPDLDLTPAEQAALNLAVAGVHLGDPTGHRALSKLGVGQPSLPSRGLNAIVGLGDLDTLSALPVLFDASRRSASTTFVYRGETRHVDVAAIRFHGGFWYVVGWDHDRNEARTFRVDRIEGTPEVGASGSAAVPDGFDPAEAFAGKPWGFGSGGVVEVTVAVDAPEAARVETELGSEAVVERGENRQITVRLHVTDVEALVSWVLDLLDHAEVLEPPEVRAAVVQRLESFGALPIGGAP